MHPATLQKRHNHLMPPISYQHPFMMPHVEEQMKLSSEFRFAEILKNYTYGLSPWPYALLAPRIYPNGVADYSMTKVPDST